jgi:hypothetical protein
MQYLILANETVDDFARRDDPADAGPYWAAWSAYIAALTESGIMQGAGGLQPPHAATTVRTRGGEHVVEDGPFADTKEQLGGYFVIEVADLDEALVWARRCPAVDSGSVEVRPLLPPPAA